jgi:hypothetical protein
MLNSKHKFASCAEENQSKWEPVYLTENETLKITGMKELAREI